MFMVVWIPFTTISVMMGCALLVARDGQKG